ncbi:FirrV-1-C2 [Feldmannia irregularis virus a]|uniref:FirrV-1-C2 n=1 Tax=Feldmannia irregularis virus a TaxID=231992 RepID=Q6XLX6_9PHYC|nr:FirrV-1-C2 [Feldmannia irregularis virus a]AAR26935.1 FirrV-1-C2 [Feldmannia irregularis virus a]
MELQKVAEKGRIFLQEAVVTGFRGMDKRIRCQEERSDVLDKRTNGIERKVDGAVVGMNTYQRYSKNENKQRKEENIEVNKNLSRLERKVEDNLALGNELKDKIETYENNRQGNLNEDPLAKSLMPSLASLFNTRTGVCAWKPVIHTDGVGKTWKVVVIDLNILKWYHTKGRPDEKVNEMKVTKFFMSILKEVDIPYEILSELLARTPFKPHQISTKESYNTHRFWVVSFSEWQKIEEENDRRYPSRPRRLRLANPKTPFSSKGNTVAYSQNAPGDFSSGYVPGFEKSFSPEEKKLIPTMGRAWTLEMLDSPEIVEFFNIPADLRGKCHIVGGKLEPATIQTHAAAYAADKLNIEAAMNRRLKRAEDRNKES